MTASGGFSDLPYMQSMAYSPHPDLRLLVAVEGLGRWLGDADDEPRVSAQERLLETLDAGFVRTLQASLATPFAAAA